MTIICTVEELSSCHIGYNHSKTRQNLVTAAPDVHKTFITGSFFFLLPCELVEPWWICFFTCICLLIIACNREIQHISLFFKKLAIRCEKKKKDFGFGSGSGLNLTVPLGSGRVGSDDLGYGPGLGFSLKPMQTSTLSPWCPSALLSRGNFFFFFFCN